MDWNILELIMPANRAEVKRGKQKTSQTVLEQSAFQAIHLLIQSKPDGCTSFFIFHIFIVIGLIILLLKISTRRLSIKSYDSRSLGNCYYNW